MARKKPVIPKDTQEIIDYRMREQGTDPFVIIAANNEGAFVRATLYGGKKWKYPGGVFKPYAPLNTPNTLQISIPKEIETKLKKGVAEEFTFCWVNIKGAQGSNLAMHQMKGYVFVKIKDNEVYCPFVNGDTTDGLIHYVDVALMKRPRTMDEQDAIGKRMFQNADRYLEDKRSEREESIEQASGGRVRHTGESLEALDGEPLVIESPVGVE